MGEMPRKELQRPAEDAAIGICKGGGIFGQGEEVASAGGALAVVGGCSVRGEREQRSGGLD